jgi:hypothetical protein
MVLSVLYVNHVNLRRSMGPKTNGTDYDSRSSSSRDQIIRSMLGSPRSVYVSTGFWVLRRLNICSLGI